MAYISTFVSEQNPYNLAYKVNNLIFKQEEDIIKETHILQFQNAEKITITNNTISFLARTTTPRTIPANLALVVSPDITYVQIYDLKANEYFILAENLISKFYKDPSDYLIIYKCK